jgi:hypothetical protein
VILEAISLVVFGALLVRHQADDIFNRAQQRLKHQATSLAEQAAEALKRGQPDSISLSVRMMGDAPSVEAAKVTDPSGRVLYSNEDDPARHPLSATELAQIAKIQGDAAQFIQLTGGDWDGVKAIVYQGRLFGYAWVKTDKIWDREQINSTLSIVLYFGMDSGTLDHPAACHSASRHARADAFARESPSISLERRGSQRSRRADRGLQPHGGLD